MSEGLKLGSVPYLNAAPLVWPLENGKFNEPRAIVRALPSELTRMLASGEIDCAVAPVASMLEIMSLVPIPEVAIACRGPVASVLLFVNGSLDDLETIWLDPASRTSNLLVQILRERASETACEFVMPEGDEAPDVENLPENSGCLIIGDRALRYSSNPEKKYNFVDLGELWREKTNHPFTFARWIARTGDIAGELRDLVREARDWSMLHLHELIEPLAEEYDFDTAIVDRYLRFNITYMHGPREQAGEREFLSEAKKLLARGAAR